LNQGTFSFDSFFFFFFFSFCFLISTSQKFSTGATCYLNSLLQCMYLTPELRAAVYAIPATHLESAANYPGNKRLLLLQLPPPPLTTTVPMSRLVRLRLCLRRLASQRHRRRQSRNRRWSSPTMILRRLLAMGFDFDMVLRVAQLYPRDANACIECLLSGGVPEDTAPPPPSRPQSVRSQASTAGEKFYNA
jgi:hypothetical protein